MNLDDNISIPDIDLNPTPNLLPPRPESTGSDTIEQILAGFPYDGTQLPSPPDTAVGPRVSSGVDTDSDTLWVSPLLMAVQKGHSKIVRILLQHDADCNTKDKDGRTPLIHATMNGDEDVVDLLLSHGAGLQLVDNNDRTALHWAVLHRHDRLLSLLLKHCAGNNAVVDAYTKEGRTALHIAIETGLEAAVEVLLKSGASVQFKARNKEGSIETPLAGVRM